MSFGSILRVDANQAALLSRISWLRRKRAATWLMLRLPEIDCPLRILTVLVLGPAPDRSWCRLLFSRHRYCFPIRQRLP
jgi:hypothetical protein